MSSVQVPIGESALQDRILAEARQLATQQITVSMSLPELWQLMAHIQLGLKHPATRKSISARQVRALIDVWTVMLEAQGAPAMAEALRRGWEE